jgi:hypothetical protein
MPGIYCPINPSGQSTITISHNLTIVADHSFQSTGGLPNIVVYGTDQSGGPNFTIPAPVPPAAAVSVTLEGFDVTASGAQVAAIQNGGSLTIWGMDFDANSGDALSNQVGATATMNESTIADGLGEALLNSGTLSLKNVSILSNSGIGLDMNSGSTTNTFNTLIANNATNGACSGAGTISNSGPGTLTDDTSCGSHVQFGNQTGVDSFVGVSASVAGTGQANTNGGPTASTALAPNSFTTLKGGGTTTLPQTAPCPTVDQRFFVNPLSPGGSGNPPAGTIQCDIGAVTGSNDPTTGNPVANSALRETTAPSCQVTGGVPSVSQQVTLGDPGSGIGPETGLATDNPSNTTATAYPPPAAVPVAGYPVSNLQDNNGSVSFTSNSAPAASFVLTAGMKTTPGTNNANWSFTGQNWAGVSKNCF